METKTWFSRPQSELLSLFQPPLSGRAFSSSSRQSREGWKFSMKCSGSQHKGSAHILPSPTEPGPVQRPPARDPAPRGRQHASPEKRDASRHPGASQLTRNDKPPLEHSCQTAAMAHVWVMKLVGHKEHCKERHRIEWKTPVDCMYFGKHSFHLCVFLFVYVLTGLQYKMHFLQWVTIQSLRATVLGQKWNTYSIQRNNKKITYISFSKANNNQKVPWTVSVNHASLSQVEF